jgi:hypothetical protein
VSRSTVQSTTRRPPGSTLPRSRTNRTDRSRS